MKPSSATTTFAARQTLLLLLLLGTIVARHGCSSFTRSGGVGGLGVHSSTSRGWIDAGRCRWRCDTFSRHRSSLSSSSPSGAHGVAAAPVVATSENVNQTTVLPFDAANDELRRLVSNDDDAVVSVEGYVTHRRSFGSALAFLDLTGPVVATSSSSSSFVAGDTGLLDLPHDDAKTMTTTPSPVQALIRREAFRGGPPETFRGYLKALQPGTKVRLVGSAAPTRNPGEALLLVQEVCILGLSSNPQHVRAVLKMALDGDNGETGSAGDTCKRLPPEEIAWAAGMASMDELVRSIGLNGSDRNYGEAAKVLLERMPPDPRRPPPPSRFETASARGGRHASAWASSLLPPVPFDLSEVPSCVRRAAARIGDGSGGFAFVKGSATTSLSVRELIDRASPPEPMVDEGAMRPVAVAAWVQNRRRFRDCVTVLELVDNFAAVVREDNMLKSADGSPSSTMAEIETVDAKLLRARFRVDWNKRIKCVLHPSIMAKVDRGDDLTVSGTDDDDDVDAPVDAYRTLAARGARVWLEGFYVLPSSSDPDESTVSILWVTRARLLRSTWHPSSVRYLLDLLARGRFDVSEAAEALSLSGGDSEGEEIASLTDLTERQWRAAELSRTLQDSNTCIGVVSKEMEEALAKYRHCRDEFPLELVELNEENGTNAKGGDSKSALRQSLPGSRWQLRKRPQLQWMVEQIRQIVESHPDCGKRPLRILDVGGGRGHLATHIMTAIGPDAVEVHVVDVCRRAVRNGMMHSRRTAVPVRYSVGDASAAEFSSVIEGKVDVVVALHACGTLSDVALGHAVSNGAAFVVCPCCFRSHPSLRVSAPVLSGTTETTVQHGDGPQNHNVAINQLELVTAADWLGIEEKTLDTLKRIAELQGDITMAGEAIHTLCALRATAAIQHHKKKQYGELANGAKESHRNGANDLQVNIKMFPISYSTRNVCLVGQRLVKD